MLYFFLQLAEVSYVLPINIEYKFKVSIFSLISFFFIILFELLLVCLHYLIKENGKTYLLLMELDVLLEYKFKIDVSACFKDVLLVIIFLWIGSK